MNSPMKRPHDFHEWCAFSVGPSVAVQRFGRTGPERRFTLSIPAHAFVMHDVPALVGRCRPRQDRGPMSEVSFNSLDLNLLRVLDALLEERSATRAGERLGLSQSAVSHALNRLRFALRDELFMRSALGLEPTARALQIGGRVRQGLLQLQIAVTDGGVAPASTDRQFVIACSDYASAAIVPGLMARLRDRAPGASLRVVPSHAGVAEALQTGRVDLGIGSFPPHPPRGAPG